MDIKYRKIIARIKPLHRLARACMYNSGIFYYKKLYLKQNYSEIFSSLKGKESGKRCFIIGNGPSLCLGDLEKLMDEDCIGTNEIHKIFDKTKWRPKYYLIMDRYSKSTPKQVADIDCQNVFLGDYYCRFNDVEREKYICLHQHYSLCRHEYKVSDNIEKKIICAPTVSFGAMQIMAYLGYKEIYLLGFDHNYSFELDKSGKVIASGKESSHFFKDDVAEDIIADVNGMTKAYEAFQKYAISHGIIIKNATRGGKLEVFERVDFDSLFDNKEEN